MPCLALKDGESFCSLELPTTSGCGITGIRTRDLGIAKPRLFYLFSRVLNVKIKKNWPFGHFVRSIITHGTMFVATFVSTPRSWRKRTAVVSAD